MTQRSMLLQLYLLGKRFGQRPSEWLRLNESTPEQAFALDFDAACWELGRDAEERALEELKSRRG